MGGWWYYYVIALGVKVPLGTMVLFGLAGINSIRRFAYDGWRSVRTDLIVLAPGLAVLVLVSSQTGFSRYLRYVLPMFPFVFVWISQVGRWFEFGTRTVPESIDRPNVPTMPNSRTRWRILAAAVAGFAILASVGNSLAVWPHSLSYFNELAGGPLHGSQYLLDANIDWGQDLLRLQEWCGSHPEARPMFLSYFGFFDPKTAGLDFPPVPGQPTTRNDLASGENEKGPLPGWHAVSVNHLHGYKHIGDESDRYAYLRRLHPVARCGYSIVIFHLTLDEAHRLRLNLELSPLAPDDLAP